ncbi:hypothetical protein JG688_00012389 [Phytophthora aleatoria]|uniref:Uncharacterized protein n=1 Tax=Phytophthora aleatoria TaxID=2496075 RepID=A0A8J5IQ32_9STRA|nr:hypothetical protein JG688_00012389 [Phytophthora aleatoria]
MKSASPDCSCEDLTKTDPCVMCGRAIHHICSNDLYDAGRLSERFCSASCLYQWKTVVSPSSASAGNVPEAHEVVPTLSQASQLSDSDVCLFPLGQSTQPVSPSLSTASVVDLTAVSTAYRPPIGIKLFPGSTLCRL